MKQLHLIANLLALIVYLSAAGFVQADSEPRPNILILLGDDIDRDHLGPWGGQAHTPHLDQLAAEGIRFDKAYANVAMCAPFRQEMYSGRCAWRTRAMPNHSRSIKGTKSIPHYLRPLGYQVGLLGKSHVGPNEAYPFDKLGNLSTKENNNEKAAKLARAYMTRARDAEAPFCLIIAANDAHGPYTHGDTDRYQPAKLILDDDTIDTPAYRSNLSKHLAEVTNLDTLLGDLRKMLVEEKLDQNTLVIFCSEQGNAFPFSKWTCFDDALSSGIVAALPGVIPAGKHNAQLMQIADIAPTLLDAAGGEVNADDFDGKSQWNNFKGADTPIHDYTYGAFCNCNIIDNRDRVFPIRSIRDKRYSLIWSPRADEEITSNTTLTQALKLVQTGEKTGNANAATSWIVKAKKDNATDHEKALAKRLHHRPQWALYDRQSDPEELTNLVDNPEMAPVLARLKTDLNTWLEKWGDSDPVATEKAFVKKH